MKLLALISVLASLTGYVNPFIGTTNFGACNPGAVVPNGMMSVSPFNVMGSELNTWDKDSRWWSTPYVYENKFFTGFTHVNLSGVGCPETGSLLTMPTAGPLQVDYHAYGSEYTDERPEPGYYGVRLTGGDILAEAATTLRTSIERYIFHAGQGNILLNLGEGLTNESGAWVRRISDTEVEGMRLAGTFCYNSQAVFPMYFVMRVSKAPSKAGFWKMQRPMTAEAAWDPDAGKYKIYDNYRREIAGDQIGCWFRYEDLAEGEQVLVQMGVSFVSCENARQNLDAEQQGFDFEAVRSAAHRAWESDLGRIRVTGGTEQQKEVFYTALYHALIHPSVLDDVNGEYPLMENPGTGRVEAGHHRYSVFSLWDTYRNVHQLLTLVWPERQTDMVRSMIDMYREWGWMPKWELFGRETFTMEGDPAICVITDTWLKGLKDFDIRTAYEAFRKSADTPGAQNKMRPDADPYNEKGYIPVGWFAGDFSGDNSVSHALEYYVADAALASLAEHLGLISSNLEEANAYRTDARKYRARSLGYKNYYSKESGTLRPIGKDGDSVRSQGRGRFLQRRRLPRRQRLELHFRRPPRRGRLCPAHGRKQGLCPETPESLRRRPLRSGQRTGHQLSVFLQPLQRRGLAHPETRQRNPGEIFHDRAGRHPGQRRHPHHVRLGRLLHDGLLPGLPGRAVLYPHDPGLRQGRNHA